MFWSANLVQIAFFCKSENWLDSRDTQWDEASSRTSFPQTARCAAFFFDRHQHGQPFSWEWVRQGSWWRWSPHRLAPRRRSRDSIGESAQHCEGQERGQPSSRSIRSHYLYSLCLHIRQIMMLNKYTVCKKRVYIQWNRFCAQVVFPPQCLALPGQDFWRRNGTSAVAVWRTIDVQRGQADENTGCKRRTTNQPDATKCFITETTGEDLKEAVEQIHLQPNSCPWTDH